PPRQNHPEPPRETLRSSAPFCSELYRPSPKPPNRRFRSFSGSTEHGIAAKFLAARRLCQKELALKTVGCRARPPERCPVRPEVASVPGSSRRTPERPD